MQSKRLNTESMHANWAEKLKGKCGEKENAWMPYKKFGCVLTIEDAIFSCGKHTTIENLWEKDGNFREWTGTWRAMLISVSQSHTTGGADEY